LLIEEVTEIGIGHMLGRVAITVLSVAAGFDQIFQHADCFFTTGHFSLLVGHISDGEKVHRSLPMSVALS
jgi:hypothetical protein